MTTPIAPVHQPALPLSHHTRQVLHTVEDWLNVERRQVLSPHQKQMLGQQLQLGLNQIESQAQQFLHNELNISPAASPVASKLLGNLNRTLQGKPQLSWALTHALAFMYLPGSLIAPLMMNAQYKRLGTLDDDSRNKLVSQYAAERATGAVIHLIPIYVGKLFADGVKRVAQQHLPLRQWATRMESSGQLPRLLTDAAHTVANGLRHTWHGLNDTRGDTAFSIGMMALFNTIGYGVVRPWITAKTTALTFAPASDTASTKMATALHGVAADAVRSPLPTVASVSSPAAVWQQVPAGQSVLRVSPGDVVDPFHLPPLSGESRHAPE